MTPVPAALARNTNTAAEGEIIVTDEEMQKLIQDIDERIDNLPEKKRRLRKVLLLEKETLQKIKVAREKGDKRGEYSQGVRYEMLKTLGEKHPFLARIAMSNIGLELFH